MEKEPNFALQSDAACTDCSLTSAIFATGRPNKQGMYVLPYSQSARRVLLSIALLGAFVYYPSFLLIAGLDKTWAAAKLVPAGAFLPNGVLSVLAFRFSEIRRQAKFF